ncbi:MAG TPA: MFS transporter, partial [Methanosarcinales archaeon]|nr:MFS transporter [Methanosarcinales archaeon]
YFDIMENDPESRYKWRAMLVVSIGIFMATLDASIINLALPTLTDYFNTDLATIEWVILSYLLTITTLLLTLGRLSDMYGRKPMFLAGMLIFTLGSGLCSLSATAGQLIAFRVVQGLGAAMLMANSPAIITDVFPHTERGKALGLVGTVVSIGSMTGPVLGGFLIYWVGWQSIFYINIPVGLLGTLYAFKTLKPDQLHDGQKFDIKGAILMFLSIISLVLVITRGHSLGWDSPAIIGLSILFAIFLAGFIIVEKRADQPMVELSLFRNRPFSASNASGFLSFVAMFAVIFLMPFYMEKILGYSPKHVGMAFIAVPLVMALVAPVSGWISDRTNSFYLSSLGVAISCLALFMLGNLDQDATFIDIVIRMGMIGLGMGLFQSPNNSIVMGSVPKNRLGIAGGMLGMVRNLGMVTGIAISGAVFTSGLHSNQAAGLVYEAAFLGGFHDAFMVAAVICAIGVITSLMRGKSEKVT